MKTKFHGKKIRVHNLTLRSPQAWISADIITQIGVLKKGVVRLGVTGRVP